MQIGGTVLIDRENTASAMEAMMPLVDVIQKEGQCVCVAPEGTRSTSTNLGRFKKGAFHLALQAGVPVVPIVIHNAIDVAPRGQFIIRPATVKITVLPPVDTSGWTAQTMGEHVDQVRDMFLEELDQMVLQGPHQRAKHEPMSETDVVKAKTKTKGNAKNNSNPADTSNTQLKAAEATDPSTRKTFATAGAVGKAAALESSKLASRVANRTKSKVAETVAKQVKDAPASNSIAKKIESKVAKSKAVKTKAVTAKPVTKEPATAKPLQDIQSKSKVVDKASTAVAYKASAALTAEADKKTPRESTADSTVSRISKRRSKAKPMVKVSARAINDDGGSETAEAKAKAAGPSSKALKKRTSKKAQDKDSN
jgi:hypothetical protein